MLGTPRIDQLFENTRSVCIGRFLIDVPVDAEVVYGPAEVPYPVRVYRDKAADLDKLVADRLAEVHGEGLPAYGALAAKDSMVGKMIDGAAPGQKIIFGISRASSAFYMVASYAQSGADIFMQEAEAMSAPEQYQKIVQELNAMALLFVSRHDQGVPVEPGVCIEDGFIRDAGHSMYEMVTLGVRLPGFNDVHFSLSATNKDVLVPSDALEPRLRQGEKIASAQGQSAWYSRIKVLRKGPRSISRWKGFEILARKPAQETEDESHEFAFLSQGEPNNPVLPVLDLAMHSGVEGNKTGGAKPSVTDAEAVAIWDRLTNSIRVRLGPPPS